MGDCRVAPDPAGHWLGLLDGVVDVVTAAILRVNSNAQFNVSLGRSIKIWYSRRISNFNFKFQDFKQSSAGKSSRN